MVKTFPSKVLVQGKEDRNPAIKLHGLRFFADQTVSELLLEMLLVATSSKRIGDVKFDSNRFLPDIDLLRHWPSPARLQYAPPARLNLKLFAFLGASRLDSRHPSHLAHYRTLVVQGLSPAHISLAGGAEALEVLRTLENLFLGFQSVGGNRTWCAASFLPIARELIAGESIWQETKARRKGVADWESALSYFGHSQQIFLARGGELLYLQLCNALRQDAELIRSWLLEAGVSASSEESNSEELHRGLTSAFAKILDACPETVGKLAVFLDTAIDPKAAEHTDCDPNTGGRRYASCGWCPEDSWREGAFFAIELVRLCSADIDPIERIELLEIACAMQLLRSLCAQSARYTIRRDAVDSEAGPLRYVWVVSDPAGRQPVVKQISRRNVSAVQRMIHDAIRHSSITDELPSMSDSDLAKAYREADGRYGHKLFLTVAKRIGLIVPRRGAGARFVLTDKLLRYLVLSTVRPGQRITYESFKRLIFAHHGLAVDDDTIGRSCSWSGTPRLTTLGGKTDTWLSEMLDASGMLIRLSDSCSLVTNPFGSGEKRA